MSAYLVSDKIIDVIVTFALDLKLVSETTIDIWGQELLDENNISVNYRYKEKTLSPEYKYTASELMGLKQIMSAIKELEYQSCEHPTWKDSAAFRLLKTLKIKCEIEMMVC